MPASLTFSAVPANHGVESEVAPSPTDRYVTEAPLGRGAWGVVYRARDSIIGRSVALKVIRFDDALPEVDRRELAARSEREARAAGCLNHPNIVTIHDAGRGSDDASFYIVMEYVEGTTLRERLSKGPVPPGEALSIVRQVAAALEYAHGHGIVHRDVKPANILLRTDGVAKLADFGIARMDSSELTRTGQSMGSPAYMSPEQALGRPVDARSDLFSIGVVLYELLAGRRPFDSESMAALCLQIVNETPPPPSGRNPSLAPGWDAIAAKAMAKKPEDRYSSAGDLLADLDRLEVMDASADAVARGVSGVLGPGLILKEAASPSVERTRTSQRDPRRAGPAAADVRGSTLTLLTGEPAGAGSNRVSNLQPGGEADAGQAMAGRRRPARRPLEIVGLLVVALVILAAARGLFYRIAHRAIVRIEVAHGLRFGDVSVAVDGEEVWKQSILGDSDGARGFFQKVTGRPAGRSEGRVRLVPGEHVFTVTAESGVDGARWTETIIREAEPGESQTLDIRIRTGLTREMELSWE